MVASAKKVLSIDEMFVFAAVDPQDGVDGVCAFMDPVTKTWMPMVGADVSRVETLRPVAREIARRTGATRLLKFTTREVLEEIKS